MAIEIIMAPSPDIEFRDAEFIRKPHGTIFLNGQEVCQTLQCPHCNAHFRSIKGSGTHRSWCGNCVAMTCGKKECVERCLPWEKKMEMIERKATQALRGL